MTKAVSSQTQVGWAPPTSCINSVASPTSSGRSHLQQGTETGFLFETLGTNQRLSSKPGFLQLAGDRTYSRVQTKLI
ncbi:MAG: hypothetical protein EBE86_032250 [Hormoscilla sp. GUM202]|nr:hypothetical protein [Hormoscilla sp. GUM202]